MSSSRTPLVGRDPLALVVHSAGARASLASKDSKTSLTNSKGAVGSPSETSSRNLKECLEVNKVAVVDPKHRQKAKTS